MTDRHIRLLCSLGEFIGVGPERGQNVAGKAANSPNELLWHNRSNALDAISSTELDLTAKSLYLLIKSMYEATAPDIGHDANSILDQYCRALQMQHRVPAGSVPAVQIFSSQIESQKLHIDRLCIYIDGLKQELATSRSDLARLRADFFNSTSWKFTRPIRAIGDFLRKAKSMISSRRSLN